MQSIFLNIDNTKQTNNYWNVYMQLHAYMPTLNTNSVQYN